jgi:Spy/CpxP family protein refolding chaperone
MKSLKVILTALALSLVATAPLAKAQEKKGQMTPEQRIERIEQAVGSLSADQKTKITAILEKSQEEMRAVPKEERKDKMPDMMKATNAKIRAVLTAEQQAKFDAMPQGGGGKKKKN